MNKLLKADIVIVAVIICIVMLPGFADRTVVKPKKKPEDLLPLGAQVYRLEYRSGTGKILARQKAIYESDVDGDGALETIIFYKKPFVTNSYRELVVAIFKEEKKNGWRLKDAKLVGKFNLGGSYLWRDNNGNPVIGYKDVDKNGAVEFYCSTAMGASCGARLHYISYAGKKGTGQYSLSEYGTFHYIKIGKNGYKVRYKDEKAWTTLRIAKAAKGKFKFIKPKGNPGKKY